MRVALDGPFEIHVGHIQLEQIGGQDAADGGEAGLRSPQVAMHKLFDVRPRLRVHLHHSELASLDIIHRLNLECVDRLPPNRGSASITMIVILSNTVLLASSMCTCGILPLEDADGRVLGYFKLLLALLDAPVDDGL